MEDKKKNKRIHKVNIQTKNEKDCNWLGLHEKCFTNVAPDIAAALKI